MGFFDILFRKKEKTYEKASLQNLEEAAKKKIEEHDASFRKDAEEFVARVNEQKKKLKESLLKLAAANTTEEVDAQLMNIAITSRKSFVKKVDSLAEIKETDSSIHSISEMHISFESMFKDIDASTVQEFASIKEVFKSESDAVIDEMKNLRKIFDEFRSRLKKAEDSIQQFEEIGIKVQILKEEAGRLESYKKDLENISQKAQTMEKENEMQRTELQKLEEGEEWKDFLVMKRKVSEKENEKRETISKIVEKFSSIERPLKKLNNILQDGEINKKQLEKYFASPFDAFLEDYEKKTINSALKEADKAGKENKIKGEDKGLEKIRDMIASDTFNNLAKEWQRINSEASETSEKIENSEISRKRDDIIKSIANRESEIKQHRREKIEEQVANLEKDYLSHKDELQQLAKETMSMEVEF